MKDGASGRVLHVKADSSQEKQQWVHAITEAKDNCNTARAGGGGGGSRGTL